MCAVYVLSRVAFCQLFIKRILYCIDVDKLTKNSLFHTSKSVTTVVIGRRATAAAAANEGDVSGH